jgi:predicted PurR-regulated permease PerM
VLNSVGLLIVGLDYAILIGSIAALLNIVPYVGGLVAVLLAVVMAFVTSDSMLYPLLVTGVLLVVQFIDNNILVPKIVASKVSINALVSIIVVLVGGALAGVSGMFLSIPFTAILKIIFDRVEGLEPWGLLLGDKIPGESEKHLNS